MLFREIEKSFPDAAFALDQDLPAQSGMFGEQFPEPGFAVAAAVDIGVVEKVDSCFERRENQFFEFVIGKLRNPHASEGDGGNGQPAFSEIDRFH